MSAIVTRPPYAMLRMQRARVAVMNPLQFELAPGDFRFVPEFATIGSLAPKAPHVCIIDGEYVSRLDWWQPVREEDRLIVFRYAGTVHGGGDSDPLRTVLTLVVMVAAIAAGQVWGTGPLSTALITAGVSTAGTLAVNALLPLPSEAGGFSSQGDASPTYNASLAGNRARLGQPIPKRYGQESYFPDEVTQPYVEYDANGDQFYCVVLCLGIGEHNVLTVELDDTDIRYFQNVSLAICGPGQTSRDSPYQTYETLPEQSIVEDNVLTAIEVGQQELISASWVGAMSPVKPGKKLDRVFFDVVLPEGLADIDLASGTPEDRTVTLQFGARRVDDAGQPLESWKVIATETLIDSTTNPIRRSFAYDLTEGRYQFRMRRALLKSSNVDHRERVIWAGLRARLNERGCKRDDCTYLAVRIRANEQLSGGSQKRIRVYSQALIPVYDPDTETWSTPQFTRNPAHAWADILHDSTTGRGLPDSRIDLLTMAELADTYDARQDRFDFSFDTRRTVDEATQLVARAGRAASVLRRGSVYTLVRDELQSTPVALFMPRNMQKDSFRMHFGLPTEETPDAVRMTYRDGRVAGDERVVWGQIHNGQVYAYGSNDDGTPQRPPGVPEPERVQEESIAGVVGRMHALREVKFLVGDAFLRRIRTEWLTELEGTLPAYGSLVGTAHDVASWGQSGDVADYDPDTLTLTASEPLVWRTGAHYVRLQTNTGGAGEAIQVTAGANAYEMVLAEAPAEQPVFDDASRERTRYLFGSLADVTRYVRVRALRRRGEQDIGIEGVLEVPEVHALDEDLLPAVGEIQDPLPSTTISEGDQDFDPYFGAVVFLPKLVGGELVDLSPAEHTITVRGTPTIEAAPDALSYFKVSTGVDDWIEVSPSRSFAFGRQPWTWEVRVERTASVRSFEPLLEFREDPDEFGLMMAHFEKLALRGDDDYFGEAGADIARSEPRELCLTYDGNVLRGFDQGVKLFEVEVQCNFTGAKRLRWGRDDDGNEYTNAYFHRMRITAGVCRYIDDYTVPSTYPLG